MKAPSPADLLNIWQQGEIQSPVHRALQLLNAGCPDVAVDTLAPLSIAKRDTLLMQLREKLFGEEIRGVTECPACGERLELMFEMADIQALSAGDTDEALWLTTAGGEAHFRLPNSLDQLAICRIADRAVARDVVVKRCLVHQRTERASEQLTPDDLFAMIDRMAAADPLGNLEIDLTCPACSHSWPAPFDIGTFLWAEIKAWAGRTLQEVHILASAYGWSEAEILALHPRRRQSYLELIGP
jgi:hypothetical protein